MEKNLANIKATKKGVFRGDSGLTPMARGSSGANAFPLAVRPYGTSSPGSPLPHLHDGHRVSEDYFYYCS